MCFQDSTRRGGCGSPPPGCGHRAGTLLLGVPAPQPAPGIKCKLNKCLLNEWVSAWVNVSTRQENWISWFGLVSDLDFKLSEEGGLRRFNQAGVSQLQHVGRIRPGSREWLSQMKSAIHLMRRTLTINSRWAKCSHASQRIPSFPLLDLYYRRLHLILTIFRILSSK